MSSAIGAKISLGAVKSFIIGKGARENLTRFRRNRPSTQSLVWLALVLAAVFWVMLGGCAAVPPVPTQSEVRPDPFELPPGSEVDPE